MTGLEVGRLKSWVDLAIQNGNSEEVGLIWTIPFFSTLANSDFLSPEKPLPRRSSDFPAASCRISLNIKAMKSVEGNWIDVDVFGSLISRLPISLTTRLPTYRKPDFADVHITYRGSSGETFTRLTKVASAMMNQSFRFATMQIHPGIFCGGTGDVAIVSYRMKFPLLNLLGQALPPAITAPGDEQNGAVVKLEDSSSNPGVIQPAAPDFKRVMSVASSKQRSHLFVGNTSSRLATSTVHGMKRYQLTWNIDDFFSQLNGETRMKSPAIDLVYEENAKKTAGAVDRWQIELIVKSDDNSRFWISGSLRSRRSNRRPLHVHYMIHYADADWKSGRTKRSRSSKFEDQFEFSVFVLNVYELASFDVQITVMLVFRSQENINRSLTIIREPQSHSSSEVGKIESSFTTDTQCHVVTWTMESLSLLLESNPSVMPPAVDLFDGKSGNLSDRWQIALLMVIATGQKIRFSITGSSRIRKNGLNKGGQVDLSFDCDGENCKVYQSAPSVGFHGKFYFEITVTGSSIREMTFTKFIFTFKYVGLHSTSIPELLPAPVTAEITLDNAVDRFILFEKEKNESLMEKVIRVVQADRVEFIKRGGYKEMFEKADEQVSTKFFVLLAQSTSQLIVDVDEAVLGKHVVKRIKSEK